MNLAQRMKSQQMILGSTLMATRTNRFSVAGLKTFSVLAL